MSFETSVLTLIASFLFSFPLANRLDAFADVFSLSFFYISQYAYISMSYDQEGQNEVGSLTHAIHLPPSLFFISSVLLSICALQPVVPCSRTSSPYHKLFLSPNILLTLLFSHHLTSKFVSIPKATQKFTCYSNQKERRPAIYICMYINSFWHELSFFPNLDGQ